MRTIFLLVIALGLFITSNAQTADQQKVGYVELDAVIVQLPDYKQLEKDLKFHNDQLQAQVAAKRADFEKKYKDYQQMPATTPEAIRTDRERELQSLDENLKKFLQEAQTSLQTKQTALMEPIYKKIGKAIDDVAKENGYTFVVNATVGGADILLYSDSKYEITELVLKKLGVTPTAITTPVKK